MFVARLGQELTERGHQVCILIAVKLLIRATSKSFSIFRTTKGRHNWLEVSGVKLQ